MRRVTRKIAAGEGLLDKQEMLYNDHRRRLAGQKAAGDRHAKNKKKYLNMIGPK